MEQKVAALNNLQFNGNLFAIELLQQKLIFILFEKNRLNTIIAISTISISILASLQIKSQPSNLVSFFRTLLCLLMLLHSLCIIL